MRTQIEYGKYGMFLPPDMLSVKALPDRKLVIEYASGETRVYDASNLQGEVFEPLKDDTIFMNPKIMYGTVTWDNGEIDIAPETLYEDSVPC